MAPYAKCAKKFFNSVVLHDSRPWWKHIWSLFEFPKSALPKVIEIPFVPVICEGGSIAKAVLALFLHPQLKGKSLLFLSIFNILIVLLNLSAEQITDLKRPLSSIENQYKCYQAYI